MDREWNGRRLREGLEDDDDGTVGLAYVNISLFTFYRVYL